MFKLRHLPSLLLIVASTSTTAVANDAQVKSVISVAGEGESTAPPDMATIRTGVITEAETARAALDQNNAAMKEIISLLKQRGVAEKDVQTTNFNVSPIHKHDPEGRRQPKIVGYRVHNEVQVRVRQLDSLGEVLDALVDAGSNQISGITFEVDDPSKILNTARGRAIRDARSRAEAYAEAAGVTAGRVLQISEQTPEPPQPMHLRMEARAAMSTVPVATGEQEFRVTVNVMYELRHQNGNRSE